MNETATVTKDDLRAPTYDLLGVNMSILNIPKAVEIIISAVEKSCKGYVCVTGMHGIMEARDDYKLQQILNGALLCTPDGMPTVWMGKAKGHREMDRVYGPDLMLAVMQATQHRPIRHFFYGGMDGVADHLKQRLEEKFPGLQVTGTYCPPFRPLNAEEKAQLRQLVEDSKADILWVGLSTPKQERFMNEYLPILPVKVMLGVGAAFDFHTGRAKQAPRWMMRSGLEWFFRLVTEPKRLGRRYLIQVPRFAMLLGLDKAGMVSHSSETPEMPALFQLGRFWPQGLAAAALLTAGAWAATLFLAGAATAFAGLGFGLLGIVLFSLSLLLVGATGEERRPDQFGPLFAFGLSLVTSVVAISNPLIILVAALLGRSEAALAYVRATTLILTIPYVGMLLLALGVVLLAGRERETKSI